MGPAKNLQLTYGQIDPGLLPYGGALYITCSDRPIRAWLGPLLEQEQPFEGKRFGFIVWVPRLWQEPEETLKNIAI